MKGEGWEQALENGTFAYFQKKKHKYICVNFPKSQKYTFNIIMYEMLFSVRSVVFVHTFRKHDIFHDISLPIF